MRIKIRHVNKDDSYDLWLWRNHPLTRKWSFKKSRISLGEHERWFRNKLRDGDTVIYIAEAEDELKLGQARFETRGGKTHININLNPDYFAKGLGNKIIRKATGCFLRERKQSGEVMAEVIKENIASFKAFSKAGYEHVAELSKFGRKIITMSYKRGRVL